MEKDSDNPSKYSAKDVQPGKSAEAGNKWLIPPLEDLLQEENQGPVSKQFGFGDDPKSANWESLDVEAEAVIDNRKSESKPPHSNHPASDETLPKPYLRRDGKGFSKSLARYFDRKSPNQSPLPSASALTDEEDLELSAEGETKSAELVGEGWFAKSGKKIRYRMWELVGRHKRDILRTYVIATRDDQQAAEHHFQDALGRLKEVYRFQATPLEKVYKEFTRNYRVCLRKAESISRRIQQIKITSQDLFQEWKQEAEWIQNPNLREKSLSKLESTENRLGKLVEALELAEASMEPALVQFYDQALYLKHNLNAQAIGALKAEARSVEREIKKLVKNMNSAIKKADAFVEALK